ncbi:hypothetical protein TNCV_4242541 [Trichonephila clavipes]|nr:hypothetical protein TNCV_4242541 [Trichonephila clavipes]
MDTLDEESPVLIVKPIFSSRLDLIAFGKSLFLQSFLEHEEISGLQRGSWGTSQRSCRNNVSHDTATLGLALSCNMITLLDSMPHH